LLACRIKSRRRGNGQGERAVPAAQVVLFVFPTARGNAKVQPEGGVAGRGPEPSSKRRLRRPRAGPQQLPPRQNPRLSPPLPPPLPRRAAPLSNGARAAAVWSLPQKPTAAAPPPRPCTQRPTPKPTTHNPPTPTPNPHPHPPSTRPQTPPPANPPTRPPAQPLPPNPYPHPTPPTPTPPSGERALAPSQAAPDQTPNPHPPTLNPPNPLPPQWWTGIGYFHPGRFWCHCRMVYLPMRSVRGEVGVSSGGGGC
jgi:hypothetical protein